MPAGWYPDPSQPGRIRYWDGSAWTAHVAPAPAPWGTPAALDPQRDLDSELRSARFARIAVYSMAVIYVAYFFTAAIVGGKVFHEFRKAVDQIQLHPNSNANPFGQQTGFITGAFLGLEGFGFLILAAEVVLVVWFFNAATFGYRAGIPARHTPIWAVIGFIVPLVNLWFPCQSAADLFEPGDDRRRIAGWWWACWLIDGLLVTPIFVVSWFSIPVALVVALIASAVPVAGARFGAALIAASGEAHRDRLPEPVPQP
jgi:hypothetical protein